MPSDSSRKVVGQKKVNLGAGDYRSVVEHLPSLYEVQSLSLSPAKRERESSLREVILNYDPSVCLYTE